MSSVIQPYDILTVVVLLGTCLYGAWKGMAWQIASLASLILSGFVAVHFGAIIVPNFNAEEPWNRILAMLILYVVTALGVWIVFRFISGLINRVKLNEFDRQMGALFGLAKGAILCIVITFFAVTMSESSREMVRKSYSGDAIARIIRNANPFLPKDVRDLVGKYIDKLDKGLDPDNQTTGKDATVLGKFNLKELEEQGRAAEQKLEDITHEFQGKGDQPEKSSE